MKYIIEKDRVLSKYIVWEKHRNYMIERFRGFKYECKRWLNDKSNRV